MADESRELPRVNWNEVLAFTHVFKSFMMARHVSKMALALAAVLLIWLWGSILDTAGGWTGTRVLDGEIAQYVQSSTRGFEKWRGGAEKTRLDALVDKWSDAHSELLGMRGFMVDLRSEAGDGDGGRYFENAFQTKLRESDQPGLILPSRDDRDKLVKKNWAKALDKVEDLLGKQVERIETLIPEAKTAARDAIDKDASLSSDAKEQAEAKLAKDVLAAGRALTLRKLKFRYAVEKMQGYGVFESLKAYEGRCLSNALLAVRFGNITGGLVLYEQMMDNRARMLPVGQPEISGIPAAVNPIPANDAPGLLFWVLMMFNGLCWLIARHWLMAILLLAVSLAIWALFGGAIHRIAALHFGRDQKISIGQALRFSAGKFPSFYFAPLIPLGIVFVIGAFIAAGGLLFGSWGGGVVMGLLLPLALIGGLLIAFLLVGLGGGGAMMYPTIAVESSDSFDAIGRSYSYVYGRPWRAAFYSLVATVYGVICYLFVRLCAFLTLAATHWFVGAGVWGGGQTLSPTADKLDVLWPAPTFDNLMANAPSEAMGGIEPIGAWLIWFWTMFVAATVMAFLLSFFASATTSIYFLLRRRIDATDLDDVYVDEPMEELGTEPTAEPAEAEKPEGETPAES